MENVISKQLSKDLHIQIDFEDENFVITINLTKEENPAYQIMMTANERTIETHIFLPPAGVMTEIEKKFGKNITMEVDNALSYLETSLREYFENKKDLSDLMKIDLKTTSSS